MRAKPLPPAEPGPSNLIGPEIAIDIGEIVGIDPCNVRGPGDDDIEPLAADLREHGLLQPLLVRMAPNGRGFVVLAGRRRYLALRRGAAADASFRVRVKVFNGGDELAHEASLAENVARAPLHPLDEAIGYARVARVAGFEAAARHFGASRRFIERQCALAALPPIAREAWRAGIIATAAARELTRAGPAAIEALFAAPDSRAALTDPAEIRRRLSPGRLLSTAPLAVFVGEAAYLAAGGRAQRDLWSDDVIWFDSALVEDLAAAKRAAEAERLRREEGWGFVVPDRAPAELAVEPDFLPDETARLAEIDDAEAMKILGLATLRALSRSDRARFGVRVSLDSEGRACVERALRLAGDLAPPPDSAAGDRPPLDSEVAAQGIAPGSGGADAESPGDARRVALTAATLAVADAVSRNFDLALRLALCACAHAGRHLRPVRIERGHGPHVVASPLAYAVGARPDFAEALALALAAPLDEVRAAFAEVVASSLDLRGAYDVVNAALLTALAPRLPGLETAIAKRLPYPDYFGRLPPAAALAAIRDVAGEAGERSRSWLKPPQLAAEGAMLARAKNWLPEFLRLPGDST